MDIHNISISLSKIDGITWIEKLNTLNRCHCCKRHQINKPSSLINWVDTPFTNNQYNHCLCNCRHLARHICRKIISRPPTPTSVIR